MATAINLIEGSLLDLGVLGEGESATANQARDGLTYLNDLLASWANEGLMIGVVSIDAFAVDGSSSYQFGSSGTWNNVQPIEIQNMYYSLSGFDYPMQSINLDQYAAISDKTATGQPTMYYVSENSPNDYSRVFLYPIPSTGSVVVNSLKPYTELAAANTVLAFPVGYKRAARLNLAVEMMPQYGIQNPLVMQLADKAKKDIMRVNMVNRPVFMALGLPAGGSFNRGNILTGY